MGFKKKLLPAIAIVCLSAGYSAQSISAPVCGLGAHWVDTCTAATLKLDITMFFGIDTDLDGLADFDASFSGAAIVKYGNAYASSPLTDPSHLDRVDTEILSMNLAGVDPMVNGWSFHMGINEGLAGSFGFVQEQADSSMALSRFDTVFELRGTPFGTLNHEGTFFFATLVDELAPVGALFNHTGQPFGTTFPLTDALGNQPINLTDQIVTNFTTIGRPHFVVDSVTVVPVPAAFWLFGSGLIGLIGLAKRNRTA